MSARRALAILISSCTLLTAAACQAPKEPAKVFVSPAAQESRTTAAATAAHETKQAAGTPAPAAPDGTTAAPSETAAAATSSATEAAAAPSETAAPTEAATETAAAPSETTAENSEATALQTVSANLLPSEAPLKDPAYFADSLFIGDSRIQGLMLYGELYDANFIYGKGLNIGQYYKKQLDIDGGGTAAELVAKNKGRYREVYIAFGINETGWPIDNFIDCYRDVVQDVMKKQPQANVYVQAILPVAHSQDNNQYVNNKVIRQFNARIEDMAQQLGVYYLDPTPAIAMEDGALPEDAATDGIHFGRSFVMKWQEYIQTHVVPAKSSAGAAAAAG